MAISQQLRDRIEAVAAELNQELYGPKGYPPWGTKFVEMEEQTGEVGDALAWIAHRLFSAGGWGAGR